MGKIENLVSVIMPTFNRADRIIPAINSIISQSYPNWELIIVDDNSRDNSRDIITKFVKEDGRIKYFFLDEKRGANAARNFGMEKASGDFITFLDSDDEYLPQKIEKQLNLFLGSFNDNLGIVSCGAIDYRNGKEYNRRMPIRREDYFTSLLSKKKNIGAGTPFLMVRNFLIKREKIAFDEKLCAMQDWDFLLRLVRVSDFDFVQDYLVKVNHHEDERIYNSKNVSKALIYLYDKYYNWLKKNPVVHKRYIKNTAVTKAHHESIELAIKFIDLTLNDFERKKDIIDLLVFKKILYAFHIKYIKLLYLKFFK